MALAGFLGAASSPPLSAQQFTAAASTRAYLGIALSGQILESGVKIGEVREGFPAALAGLQAGDVIVGFQGEAVSDGQALYERMRALKIGDVVTIDYERDHQGRRATMTAVNRDGQNAPPVAEIAVPAAEPPLVAAPKEPVALAAAPAPPPQLAPAPAAIAPRPAEAPGTAAASPSVTADAGARPAAIDTVPPQAIAAPAAAPSASPLAPPSVPATPLPAVAVSAPVSAAAAPVLAPPQAATAAVEPPPAPSVSPAPAPAPSVSAPQPRPIEPPAAAVAAAHGGASIGIRGDAKWAQAGVSVVAVRPGFPAEAAGIQIGDVITRFAGAPVASPEELRARIAAMKAGDVVSVGFFRYVGPLRRAFDASLTLAAGDGAKW